MRPLLHRCFKTPQPHLGQQPVIPSVGSTQGFEIFTARGRLGRCSFNMGQGDLIEECRQQYPADATVEILEGMNPLKPPVGPRQELGRAPDGHTRIMPQAFSQVVAELPYVDRHFVIGRREMGTDLHTHIAEPTGPIRKQMPSQPFMAHAEPFGIDDDLIRLGLKNLVVNGNEWNSEAFGEF